MSAFRNIQSMLKSNVDNGVFALSGAGAPVSGSGTNATGKGTAGLGSTYINTSNGVMYINEGSSTSPYWTPVDFTQTNLLCWRSDFRDGVGNAIAATTATVTIPGSGIRNFGTGIEETDSGFTITVDEDGAVGSLIASATSGKVAALGVGITTSVPFQPNTMGPLVIEALVAQSSAITARKIFCGFLGTAADALASPSTGATTVITMVQDDMAGLLMDSGLTAAARFFAPHNKSDEAATISTAATGVDTGVDCAAAGTYQLLRVEISAAGVMTCFIDKAQVTQIEASLDVDEEMAPVLCITSLASATKTMLVKKFAAWGNRRASL